MCRLRTRRQEDGDPRCEGLLTRLPGLYGEAMKQREQNAILKSEVDVARQKQKERQDMLRYCHWTVILSVRSWRTRWSA